MAEDLGTIRIDFGDPGRGPEATKAQAAKVATGAAGAMNLAQWAASIANPIVAATGEVFDAVSRIADYVQRGINNIIEATKFGGAGLTEAIRLRIQQIQQDFKQAQVLGPLYAMVLRWYRELMALLYPWRLFFSAITTALVGAIVGILKAIMPSLMPVLQAMLTLSKWIAGGIATIAEGVASAVGGLYRMMAMIAENMAAFVPGSSVQSAGLLDWMRDMADVFEATAEDNYFIDAARLLRQIANELGVAVDNVQAINRNTRPAGDDNLWINTQLRDLAAKSPLYPQRDTPGLSQPEFWHPPGSTYGTR